ncbi:Winged helix DNA-binding domain superfamily [Sesbania bispinosa]|nr:Winged helix DNA-binding domain superfamily [Sesbania bispinosa]
MTNLRCAMQQERRRRGPTKRKRRQAEANAMDYEQTRIPVHMYQHWLQNASDIVSRRGRKKKRTCIMSSTKIANLMKLPPVVLIGDLFTSENNDIYYPAPLLDLWIKSTQPPHDSPSGQFSLSLSLSRGENLLDFYKEKSKQKVTNINFMQKGFQHTILQNHHFLHLQDGLDSQFLAAPIEKLRNNDQHNEILMDELRANLDNGVRGPEATPHVSSGKSGGDSVHSFPRSVSEHGPGSHSSFDKRRFTKKRHSSSGNSSGGLEPVAENANFKLARLSEVGPTPDQELLVETGPTQTQVKTNHPSDEITDSIQAQMKAHFDTPGVPQVESLDILAAGMTRKSAALLFYQTCVLASRDALKVEQKVSYGEILISRGAKM